MKAVALLQRVTAAGVRLRLVGADQIEAIGGLTDEQIEFLRAHKAELMAELRAANEVSDDTNEIRARLFADLKANPGLVHAVEVIDSDGDPVRALVAIRDIGTAELQIDAERWDPSKFLELVVAGRKVVG